ncbi:putative dehydrogenase [Klebsiella pneumoniae]|nr:putative dehydrogenase [Klebsiella pneumoniae]
MTIAFIGFGEAGGILAADLAREHAVTMWIASSMARSER